MASACCWTGGNHVGDPLVDARVDVGGRCMYGRSPLVRMKGRGGVTCDAGVFWKDGSEGGDGACERCFFTGR